MNEQEIRKIVQNEIFNTSRQNQYDVSPVPIHTHNGTDSVQVSFESLVNASSYIALKTVTLSPSQILSLNTTPVILIPSFGTNASNIGINYVYIVEGITARLYYGSVAYTGANNLEFRYSDASGIKVTADLPATFINSSANTFAHVAGIVTAFTPVFNSPIVVTVPTANPATGNSKIILVIKYRVVSI